MGRRRPKLPEPTLPTFNGEYESWISFKSEFEAMIHNQTDINTIDRLTYLRRSLTGPAYNKVKMLAITPENYDETWRLLEQTYSDSRIIASRHLYLLLSLPVQGKEAAAGLTKLTDDTRQHLAALKSMNINVSYEIVVTILERKIHETTGDKWNTLKRGVFPKLEDMLEFLSSRASRLINRQNDKSLHIHDSQGTSRKPPKRSYNQAFASYTEKRCFVCKERAPHPLFRCEKFKTSSPTQRLKTITDASMCVNCLRGNHQVEDCHSHINCWVCEGRHKTLLHKAINSEKPAGNGASYHQRSTSIQDHAKE
ncbi:uncharacterized protein LOC105696564 [Orussus abietinus]|uniref:uncharacterized protein LOC105696564 n=1 Tax=Orussus abietinus TaxID=222816 RepID=UPI00062578E2|nr:uncharacterized protein LOC105696564 [Orussus abietinus]